MSCEISSLNYGVGLGTKASKSLFTSSETLPVTAVIDRKAIVRDLIQGIMFSEELIKRSNHSYRVKRNSVCAIATSQAAHAKDPTSLNSRQCSGQSTRKRGA